MPPQTVNTSTDTPSRVRHSFDRIIERLNVRCNLDLPSLHGTQETALEEADAVHSLARRCAGRIRYLCYRDCQLDQVIKDFEDDVPRICSQWVWKPAQEKGTLPRMPITKSFISTKPEIPLKHRPDLLNRLFELLDEEFKLARESEVYRRSSFNSSLSALAGHKVETAATTLAKARTHSPIRVAERQAPGITNNAAGERRLQVQHSPETMKRKSSESEQSVKSVKCAKSAKKQMTLSQLENRRISIGAERAVDHAPVARPSITPGIISGAQSFASTTASSVRTDIFTPATTSINAPSASAASVATASTSFPEGSNNFGPALFPPRDMTAIGADPDFQRSFTESFEPSKAHGLYVGLCEKTPFKSARLALPHRVTFRHRYELQRVADALGTNPGDLLGDLRRKRLSSIDDYNTFWRAVREIAKDLGKQLPEKSSSAAWDSALDSFFEEQSPAKRSVYLGGALSFKVKVDEGLFDFKLKSLQLDKSCRFHRKYGPSRFMVVSLPSLTAQVPRKLTQDAQSGVLAGAISQWLATTHEFLGRKWKAFFLEADKKKAKGTDPIPGYKIHLFAVSGEDIPAKDMTELEQFLDWHLAVDQNIKSTDLKLFQRLSLGLSKTTSTFPLDVSEFIRLPDPADHAVMNDGCARVSMTLAKDIAQHLYLTEVPSVYQGRIAGAKGLWMVVPDHEFPDIGARKYCIEISDSQLKIHPHPKDNPGADEAQRTFEVLKYSAPGKPAALNSQLLTILHDRGVSRKILGDLLSADVGTFYEELELSMRSPFRLRSWIQSSGNYTRGDAEIREIGSWPDEIEEQAILLIESGFVPETCSLLLECLRGMLTNYLQGYVDRMQIRIPCSTYLFCIADPYGVLKPDEVHLSFSEVWRDAVSDFKEAFVDGRDILIARLPALLPSDIQRRRAVWKRELHHFKDVIVFPTTGEVPLAHMLSGGDYDGDTPWICWDPTVVNLFENVDMPKMPSKEDCGLIQHSQRLRDLFPEESSKTQRASQVNSFLVGCFKFNLHASYLGQCTLEHERLVYSQGNLSAPHAIKLATLSGYLVDSAKQGDMLTEKAWKRVRNEISPQRRPDPAWKIQDSGQGKLHSNIMDYLKFQQAEPKKKSILTLFHTNWKHVTLTRDASLSQPWNSSWSRSNSKSSSQELKQVLSQLRADIKQVADDWTSQGHGKGQWAAGQFRQVIENLCEKFNAIKPLEIDHELAPCWKSEEGGRLRPWSLLKASCLYSEARAERMIWHVAGEQLCFLKACEAEEGFRAVPKRFYSILKCDSKSAKRKQLRIDGAAFEEETFGYEDMGKVLMMDGEE